MSSLRIFLFGGVRVGRDGCPSELKVTRTERELLAYLLLQGQRSHPRDVLADVLWGDHPGDRARSCLSTALWRLRCSLEGEGTPRGSYLTITPAGQVSFNWQSNHWLDLSVFEAQASKVLTQPLDKIGNADIRDLEGALSLCTGELVEGLYHDWALRERERVRSVHLNCLARLMSYYKQRGAYEESLAYGQRILDRDPLREEIHREMMRIYSESGQRTLALRQYHICRDILAAELGVLPMEETQALHDQIAPQAGHRRGQSAAETTLPGLQQAMRQLRIAVWRLDESHHQVQRALRLVERFVGHPNPDVDADR